VVTSHKNRIFNRIRMTYDETSATDEC